MTHPVFKNRQGVAPHAWKFDSLLRPKNACKAAQSGQSANQGPCFASALQIARSGRDSGNCAVRHIETIAQRSRRSQHRGVRDSLSTVRLSRIPTLSCRRATGLWPKRSPYARRQHSRRREARSGLGPGRRRSVRARPRHAVEVVALLHLTQARQRVRVVELVEFGRPIGEVEIAPTGGPRLESVADGVDVRVDRVRPSRAPSPFRRRGRRTLIAAGPRLTSFAGAFSAIADISQPGARRASLGWRMGTCGGDARWREEPIDPSRLVAYFERFGLPERLD